VSVALAALGLEGFDGVSGLLHSARHEAADRVLLPTHRFHDLGERRAILPLKHRDDLRRLAALARTSAFRLSGLLDFGRILGRGGFLGRLAFAGAASCQDDSLIDRPSDPASI
jgi:hypothetical protein